MRPTRVAATTWLTLILLPLMIIGCQLGFGEQPAPTPLPPTTPILPEIRVTPGYKPHIKVVDGYLYVVHSPCPPTQVDPQSAIVLTNLYDGSIMFLNGDGSINTRKRHDFKTEEGRTRLHKALGDRSTVRLITILPKCPKR